MATNHREILDSTNINLLQELQDDARLTVAELGRRVGLSSPAVAERLQRLQDAGVIRGYHADVDPASAGYALTVIIRVRPAPRQLAKVAALAQATPEVVECHRITGEDCFLVKVHAASIGALESVLDQFLTYGQTVTSIVVSTPVPLRALPVDAPIG